MKNSKEAELKRLEDLEKKIAKLKKKGRKIIFELEQDDLYHSLGEQFARRDFSNAVEWMDSAIESKIKFLK
ncbi:MAG: hypothetical protein J6Y02_01200 [Pseudobutyrivibrio sp.]|nr:hypothetical protein [Pseudobutyrivibrio sp.]